MEPEAPAIEATDEAIALVRRLRDRHGPLMFHQSGGCCDGSAPMCYPRGELRLGARDVLLGFVDGEPFYIGGDQYERWRHTRLILDVTRGRGASFSLEIPEGLRFLVRSEVCATPPTA